MQLRLGSIVEALGGELVGNPALAIEGLAPLESATGAQLSFLSNPRYQQQLSASQAACVIVAPEFREAAAARGACIVTDDPYLYFARVTQLWKKQRAEPAAPPIHPTAVIDPEAVIDPTARIGPQCVIERGALLNARVDPRTTARVGSAVRLAVDPARFHFFDPDSGASLLGLTFLGRLESYEFRGRKLVLKWRDPGA